MNRTRWTICTVGKAAIVAAILLRFSPASALAGDWPMWRYDAGHTAACEHALPARLRLQWARELPAPRPAWPASQAKLQFDASYEPVAAGQSLFVPSMVNDSVTAYDTRTGAEKWRFYADGPVRFAPVVWRDRVYFVSDDGHLYCLSARDGSQQWKFRGGPSDRRVLGNDRLVSAWPARGAPVLYDGTIYFAASIWPFMGTFIHALDAATGNVVWSNSGSGSIYIKQPHSAPSFAGVAPQGYMAATADRLFIAGGRSVPACYDRHTGKFLYFDINSRQFGKTTGGYGVAASKGLFFNGVGIYRGEDGAGLLRVAPPVLAEDAILSVSKGALAASSYATDEREVTKKDRRGRERKVKVYFHKLTRRAALDPRLSRAVMKAGNRLFLAGDDMVAAVELDSDAATCTVTWEAQVPGEPWTMLAADDRLFVVTREGWLGCFGSGGGRPRTRRPRPAAASRKSPWTQKARAILEATRKREGYCVVAGVGSGRLAEELVRQSKLFVIAVDDDAEKVDAARRRLDRLGLYGTRVSVHNAKLPDLPPYLADLIVSEDPAAAGVGGSAAAEHVAAAARDMFRVLRPYAGVACLSPDAGGNAAFAAAAEGAHLANARLSRRGPLVLLEREGALPGSADWTHQYADAANSIVSRDRLVRAPLGLLWFGGPPHDKVLPRHGHGPTPQVIGGRLFIEGENLLRSVDVYTGRLLWERDFPDLGFYYRHTAHHPGANEIGSNYASAADGIYVVYKDRILRLDPASGRTLSELGPAPAAGAEPPRWGYVSLWQNLLVATSSPLAIPLPKRRKPNQPSKDSTPLIPQAAEWRYLGGSHPADEWTQPDFDDSAWQTGKAGFGYGDGDDQTVLPMRRKYTVVYIRHAFDAQAAAAEMGLMVRYDDAFIAYLNGREVVRAGVKKGRGRGASGINGHEAKGHDYFPIRSFKQFLRKGPNVLAIEGHNVNLGSSDFSLDPYLITSPGGGAATETVAPQVELHKVEGVDTAAAYSSASKCLVVMDRPIGRVLWTRKAKLNFRHNAIAVAAGKVFCIDAHSPKKLAYLKRRGYAPTDAPRLMALDVRTGDVLWSTDEDVFGTWLGYSEEHGVLLQGGSAFRDRAKDEVDKGMVAYRGRDGAVLWKDLDTKYNGPLVLHHDRILTNGSSGGKALHLLTGKDTGWTYRRNYGCNTVVASEHLITFRSGAAGFCDLANDGGTANLGGFKSGCTSNLIAANGVLNAPDYTRTCICAYQNQCSLAFVHDPSTETWTFGAPAPVGRFGVNLGAPGDRRDAAGTLWLDYPSVGGPSPALTLTVAPADVTWPRKHSLTMAGGPLPWVAASGVEGVTALTVTLPAGLEPGGTYTVRCHFAELLGKKPGDRVFHLAIQGDRVLRDFDIARAAGAADRGVVKEFRRVRAADTLTLSFVPVAGQPLICGIEVIAARGGP